MLQVHPNQILNLADLALLTVDKGDIFNLQPKNVPVATLSI